MTLSAETVRAIAAFIPSNIACQLADGQQFTPGQELSTIGVGLFADIAGFTIMAEQLVNLMKNTQNGAGYRGAEELNGIINKIFTAIIRPIHAHGGIVTRFGGDALSAYFPDKSPKHPQNIIQQALHCATQMQQAINPLSQVIIEGQPFSISIKIGLSYGKALIIFLGDTNQFMEVIFAGPVINEAAQAEQQAERGHNILAPALIRHVPHLDCTSLSHGFARLNKLPHFNLSTYSPLNPLKNLAPSNYNTYLNTLKPYLPLTVFKQLKSSEGNILGNYRRVSNIFVAFKGINYTKTGVGKKLQAYIAWVYKTVTQFDGTLLRVLTGDKGNVLHITFGAPDQHANDIELALRCALALRDDDQRPPFIVSQQIGIASGLVFTAPIGSNKRREYTVIGSEINLSARLMAATKPNTILVDDYSQERTGHRFQFTPLPPLRLKGKPYPITTHHLLAERTIETGLEARFLSSRWPIVGRAQELKLLTKTVHTALNNKGQIIALSGPLGIGKTRLIEEVVRLWLEKGGNGFMGQCNQHLKNNPYQAWIGFWYDFFKLPSQALPQQRRQKIIDVVATLAPDMSNWIDALGNILGCPIPDNSPLLSLDAEARRQKLFTLSLALLQAKAKQQPLLILFEDLHWIDEASADLIEYVAARIRDNAILMCVLFRSTHQVPVGVIALPHCTWQNLTDLPANKIDALMQAILGKAIIPPEISQEMFNRTHGVPLYVEEIISNLLANKALTHDGQQYKFKNTKQLIHIPDTLQDLIRSRLDRLDTETRNLAQVAATINRQFSYSMLHSIYPYPMSSTQMRNRLDELQFNDITTLVQTEPDLTYLFKHALAHEVAYTSLSFAHRQTLHHKIANVIETKHNTDIEEYYSALAHHYQQAHTLDKALHYAVAAGQRAQQLYANKIALQYYQQAEGYLKKLPLKKHWSEATQLYLNQAQLHCRDADMTTAQNNLEQALNLAKTYKDPYSQAKSYNLKAEFSFYQENAQLIQQAALRAYNLANTHNYLDEKATALYHLGLADMLTAKFERAMDHLQKAYTLAINQHYPDLEGKVLNTIAIVQYHNGHPNWALKTFKKVQTLRHTLGLKDKEAETLSNIATMQLRVGQPNQAFKTCQQAIKLANQAGWQLLIPYVNLLQVEILAYTGQYTKAEALITKTYTKFDAEDIVGNTYAKVTHGREILVDLGRLNKANRLLNESLVVLKKHKIYEELARCLIGLGILNSKQNNLKKAESFLEEAKSICLENHKSWYLAEIYTYLAEIYIKNNNLTIAQQTIKRGLNTIKQGSNPDWHGLLLFLNTQIAYQQSNSITKTSKAYLEAAQHIRHRSKAIERSRLLIFIGNQLLNHKKPKIKRIAESLINEGYQIINN